MIEITGGCDNDHQRVDFREAESILACILARGVDPAAAMLEVARQTLRRTGRVGRVLRTDIQIATEVRPDPHAGHAFQVLLTDADATAVLETMHLDLKQRGTVVFETRNPRVDWVGEWRAKSRMLPGGEITETLNITSVVGEFISFRTSYRLSDPTVTTNSTLRYPSREHVEALITRSGLLVREVFGDWNACPFESDSREMIFITQIASNLVWAPASLSVIAIFRQVTPVRPHFLVSIQAISWLSRPAGGGAGRHRRDGKGVEPLSPLCWVWHARRLHSIAALAS